MAIFYPPLYCPKGTILEALKDVDFETFEIRKGNKCYVYDIQGYGFDIYPLWDEKNIFRITNSELPNYFKVLAKPKKDKLDIIFSEYRVKFKKDFSVNGVINIAKGKEYYFEVDKVDKSFYDLFDEYRKVVRLKESEAIEFLEFIS